MVIDKLKERVVILAVVFIGIIFLAVIAVASTNYLYENLVTNYSAGDTIKGNFSISFSQEPVNKIFTSNFPGNISLVDFLKAQSGVSEGAEYNCSTQNCVGQYISQEITTGFLVGAGESKFAGFKLTGTDISITKAGFSVLSNVVASCAPQINIDPLADGENIFVNSAAGTQSCGTRHVGCYNQVNTAEAPIVINKEYCEKITMPAAPAFIVGGEIRNGTALADLTMILYEFSGAEAGRCKLPRHTQTLQELSCRINHTASETQEYYLCIKTSNNAGYKIGWEVNAPTCGTAVGFGSLNSDFDLFAETIQYAGSPYFAINDSEYESQYNIRLANVLDDYLVEVYGRNCQSQPCFLPIKFFGDSQTITLSNAYLEYESVGVPASVSEMHLLDYTPAKITGDNLSLDISKANFVIPITSTTDEFKLFLDGNQLFQKEINLRKSFAVDVNPKVVVFGQNVQFMAFGGENITSTSWNFGDGTATQNVNGSMVAHRYVRTNMSVFELTLTAMSDQGWQTTKKFNINVTNPREFANDTIQDYKVRVENLTSQIYNYDSWIIQKLQERLDLQNATSKINQIENDYRSAVTERDFQDVMLDLIALNIPKRIYTIKSGEALPLAIGYESVNINYLEKIENKNVQDKAKVTERAIGWMNGHFSPEVSFKQIAAEYEFDSVVLASVFAVETKPIGVLSDKTFIIFGQDIENAGAYKTNYNVKSISGIGIDYLELDTSSNKIFEFILQDKVEVENLGTYISPRLNVLDVVEIGGACVLNGICDDDENAESCPEDCSKKAMTFIIIGWIVLIISAIVVYVIMQEWYKHNYQNKLFKDENSLYNLINFIYNARKARLNDEQIKNKLLQQGWTNEQIRFAFKKIEGKTLGMLEIPLFTHIQHKKTIEKLATRQGAPLDARFIKRTNFR